MTAKDVYQEFVVNHFIEYNKNMVTEMELLFLMNSNPKLKSLVQRYKERLFHLNWDEIEMLRTVILNIKKEQECSHSNRSQTPK